MLCCAALLTAAYLWRRQRRRLLRGSAATVFCHFNSCALCKADALLSIFHRQLMIYAKISFLLVFSWLYLLYSSRLTALFMLRLCPSAVLLHVHYFLQSATKLFLFTRTRNQFVVSIFHAHTHKHTPVWAWSRNESDFMLQMSLGSKSQSFNLTFGLTHTQVHSVCPIFSNFRILILPGKAMFAALKSHLYCAVLEWRMK